MNFTFIVWTFSFLSCDQLFYYSKDKFRELPHDPSGCTGRPRSGGHESRCSRDQWQERYSVVQKSGLIFSFWISNTLLLALFLHFLKLTEFKSNELCYVQWWTKTWTCPSAVQCTLYIQWCESLYLSSLLKFHFCFYLFPCVLFLVFLRPRQ